MKIGYKLIFFILLFPPIFSQENNKAIDLSVAEKIYLQLHSNAYAMDQNIWFKAIVTDSENHIPSNLSRLLYVDLIGPNEQIMAHRLVKLTQGIGKGSFELNKNMPQGRYLIRAYTQWNSNFGDDFMFKAYVDLYAPTQNNDKAPIESLSVVEKEHGRWTLTAELRPQIIGSENERQVQVYLNWGKGKDTIKVNRKGHNLFPLDYEIQEKLDWITLTLDTGQGLHHTKTLVINTPPIDLQFFPESGDIIHGFRNKIGFKAVSLDGKGKMVQGEILDAKSRKVATFRSNHLGMGFFFVEADSTSTYSAKIVYSDSLVTEVTYPLPKVVSKGSILSVSRAKDKIRIQVESNYLNDHVFIKASCRGTDYYLMEGPLREGRLSYHLPSSKLPEGIIVFTLMDEERIPVAERLYFNESEHDRLDISLSTDKKHYGRKESTKLDIEVSGKGSAPTTTDLSILAINKEHWHQGKGETIRSNFLLTSELRGEVEEPDYYFREDSRSRYNNLDALLLTQGWRRYKYPAKRKGAKFYWPQPALAVKGTVRSGFPKRELVRNADISLVTFGKAPTFYTQRTDSMGRFHFLLDDAYGKRMKILLNSKDQEGKKSNYTIFMDTPNSPKVEYEPTISVEEVDSVARAVVKAQKERQKTEAIFDSLYGVTQLDEVVVEGYRLTPERQKAYKQFGEPDVVIEGDVIRSKERKWSYGLYSILMFEYGHQLTIEQFSDGFMLAHVIGGRGEPTLLVVDGKLLTKEEYEFVPQMPPGIVESVEIIKYAKFFVKQYLTVFPETDPLEAPTLGHIISVYTKGGVGIHVTDSPAPGTMESTIEIFSPEKEFYAPKYDRPAEDNQKPDLRSLIHWSPSIKTDQDGKVSASFYNGDIAGDYIIVVEAISEDGRIGYLEKNYSVEAEDY
ncbi:hypothetical protein SAMN03080594_101683 [Arenibacter palladensis]|uniref:MG2 domain-containing protein n=1 Tax=Arenibacter palladensis TaxID=237373 RepID=A0A1M4UMV6_9FLAO|nr:hypothetical protein [Arenibacter palladensis]SHE57987.1 hypothetical protein SAMN03080594_101683 [Arenibacter palladensis]